MDSSQIFYRFSPLVQDFIYANGWETIRPIQIEAAKIIFDTNDNLILSSDTASGKTEAVFFPIISEMENSFAESVEVLYIAPLKSLINDQFERIDALLRDSGIPVFHWHGDVAASHKNKLLKHPAGVLQITPESLESMLMNKHSDIIRLFGRLRYVIIDEIHTLMSADRGNQILCQLDRIAEIIGYHPRRIGLSATIGNLEKAKIWLTGNSGRSTAVPSVPSAKHRIRLAAEHFYIQDNSASREISPAEHPEAAIAIDAGYEYIYDCAKDRKSIVFSNSREETEYVTATLRQIASNRGDEDIFYIHHGNLSAAIREEAEQKLKAEQKCVACATVTLELGIDIGRIERILNVGAPTTVSSFLQRLGRSGRKTGISELFMVFREEKPLPDTPLPQLIPWELVRGIAVVQLYIEEKFIEPPSVKKMPLSLMFQQTLSILASSGENTPKRLAEKIFALSPFSHVEKEDYRELLISMIKNEYVEMTENKGLILGLRGEKLTKSFKFYAVFKDSEDYSVKHESEEIGTISSPPPVGDRFALAGRVWEVEELDLTRKLIYVHPVPGKMQVAWPGDYGEIHTKVLEMMFKVLTSDTEYPYLKPNAKERLAAARRVFKNAGMAQTLLISLGGNTKCLLPWLGTRSFRTLRKYLQTNASYFGIYGLEYDGCYYMTFKCETEAEELLQMIRRKITNDTIETIDLVGKGECPIFEKYDPCIPPELLRRAYAADKLRTDEMKRRFRPKTEGERNGLSNV
ncbi:MAG: DEAD/DEAH box helicase [Clostridia bacterium]|nr:DEAD/DEAH box helicase [Clostridia bacterium]